MPEVFTSTLILIDANTVMVFNSVHVNLFPQIGIENGLLLTQ